MAKRFLKQNARTKSADVGCLSGVIGIFDFHLGHYSQKLLSDRKRSNARGKISFPWYPYANANGSSRKKLDFPCNIAIKLEEVDASLHKDDDKIKVKKDTSGMISVKTLMEEEMSRTQNAEIQNSKHEHSQSKSESGIHLKENNKKKNKKCDDLTSSLAQFYCDSEINSLPLPESITRRKKIHLDDNDSKLSGKNLILRKALDDATKVFLSQKLVGSNELISNTAFQSKEFMDALETLSSNKELLVNLIQDQSFNQLRHIQDIQDALGSEIIEDTSTSEKIEDSVSSELILKQRHQKFFRKKDKLKGSGSSHGMSKIVILEPSLVSIQNGSVTQIQSSSPLSHHSLKNQDGIITKSYFSIKGIKRKLRQVMGENKKAQHLIPMDRLLNRISYVSQDSGDTRKGVVLASETSCIFQNTSQLSAVGKIREKPKLKIEHPQHRDSVIGYLNEMEIVRDEKDTSPTVSKSLERVVSLSECNLLSPRFGQGKEEELVLSPRKIIFSPSRQLNGEIPLSPLNQSFDQDAKMCLTEMNQECREDNLKLKGSMEIVESSEIKILKQHVDLDKLPESIGKEAAVNCEVCEEEGSSSLGGLNTPDNKPLLVIPSLSISPGFLHIESAENSDGVLEKMDRPSPVFALEPFFLEDTINQGSTTGNQVDSPLQHQQIDFQEHNHSITVADSESQPLACFDEKEATFGFITTLLQSSGLNHSRILETQNSCDNFLDPSLLEEAGTLFNLLPDDAMLLFDCINEILAEIKERLFSCTSWVYLIKPSSQVILRGPDFIQEVCEGIDGHLQLLEYSLDEFARKDLEGRSWMDLWLEIEEIVFEMADVILDEIIKEDVSKT